MQTFSVFIAHHMGLFYALSLTLIALMIVEFIRSKRTQALVDSKGAIFLINRKNAVVIDIRQQDNFKKGHIIDSLNFPELPQSEAPKKLTKYKSKTVIVVCNTGTDSQKTASVLTKEGYNTVALAGGIRAWVAADLPLVKE